MSEQVEDKNVDAHAGESDVVLVENNQAVGVVTLDRSDNQHYFADAVILATGGYRTLVNSGHQPNGQRAYISMMRGQTLSMEMISFIRHCSEW